MALDRITLKVLGDRCQAAAETMAYSLFRTAYSAFVKETEDFTTGLTTPRGQTFASPKDLGATWFVGLDYGNVIDMIRDYRPGDICITNDPYSGFVCTHSPDLHLWKPIFHGDEVVAFAVSHVHNTDVGGAVPASLSRTLTEVHQEGIRIPPTKLYREGRLDESLLGVMMTNVRAPEQNWGDLKAQVAAANSGEIKIHEAIAKFGLPAFREGIESLLDLSEQQTRAIIRTIPDGTYFFADFIDEDSDGGPPCRIALALEITGDEVRMDFTGSDPQLRSALNVPTGGNPRHILLMIGLNYVLYTLDPTLMLNCGVHRAASCILPEGSVINPQFPAAVGMRTLTVKRLAGVVMGAFSMALPDRLPAGAQGASTLVNIRAPGRGDGKIIMACLGPVTGGAGASAEGDGSEGSGADSGFLKNTPVEVNENEVPVRILRYELARDSGGPGTWRGGQGTIMEFQVFTPETVVTTRNRDRCRFTPFGIRGGQAGAASTSVLNPDSPDRRRDLANTDVVTLAPNDILRIYGAGGGGWGDPLARDPATVLADVRRGRISEQAARDSYGVILRGREVDPDATAAARRSRPKAAAGHFGFGEAREAYERIWTPANYAALTEVLGQVPVAWRFFVKHRIFAAIAALPSDRRAGDGSEVRAAFAAVAAEYPQLRATESSIG